MMTRTPRLMRSQLKIGGRLGDPVTAGPLPRGVSLGRRSSRTPRGLGTGCGFDLGVRRAGWRGFEASSFFGSSGLMVGGDGPRFVAA